MRNRELGKKIEALERMVLEQQQLIEHLDKVNQMHVQAEELSRQERLSADKVLHAQEQLQELAARERMEADRMILAQKELHALTERERREAADINRALLEVQELSTRERIESEGYLEAHQRVKEMTIEEIRQRDAVLEAILDISKQINKLLPEGELFSLILSSAMERLAADAGAVVVFGDEAPRIRLARGFPEDIVEAAIIARARVAQNERQGGPGAARGEMHMHLVSCLTRESRPTGLIYLEKRDPDNCFRNLDQEFLDLFASHASMACNNAALFNRVQDQNRELKRALMLKNNFIDHLADDIRKPLSKLAGMVEKLPEGKTRNQAVDLAGWLVRALDRVLSVAALNQESEEMFSHRISVVQLANEILANLAPEIKRLKLTTEVVADGAVPDLEGNRDIYNTILDEVLCNAVVYNRKGGHVSVRVSARDQRLFIQVKDSGVGIKKSEIKKVFDRFYRSEHSYDQYPRGAGLGLFIVRSFIENYGGTISLNSSEGVGTEILIEIPC